MGLVYVSSSYRDLRDYRRRIAEKLRQLGHVPIGMEADGASEHPALIECLKDVRRSAAYIGLLGFRYGSIPIGKTQSYTEIEYEEAGLHDKPRWMFLATPNVQNYLPGFVDDNRQAIDDFRARVSVANSPIEFSSPAELATAIERTVKQQLGPGRSMPPFLPYLCDRQDQIEALQQALSERIERRPILLVIHGDSRELHHRFVERIRVFTIREILHLRETEPVCEVRLKWPETAGSQRRYSDWFTGQLATSEIARTARRRDLGEVLQHLATKRAPILVSARLEIERWSATSEEAIRVFAQFWETSPDFPSDFPFVVCLSIVYPPQQRSWWQLRRNAADRVSQALDQLELKALTRVTVSLAPRLGDRSVSRQHVDNWISVELARLTEGFALDEDALRREVDAFFSEYEGTHGSSCIPMGILTDHLKKVLEIHLAESRDRGGLFS